MKRGFILFCSLILTLTACQSNAARQAADTASTVSSEQAALIRSVGSSGHASLPPVGGGEKAQAASGKDSAAARQIRITAKEGGEIVFQLNDSSAADSFYSQLPLSIGVEDYAGSEKIFYPPEELDVSDTPPAQGPAGTLAFYAPWGNVAIFYGECGGASGLYELGEAVSGVEFLATLTGEVQIEAG